MSATKVSNSQPVVGGDLSKKGAGKEKDNSSGHPERAPSAEDVKCAICLGDVVNRSCSNSCVHQFCFGCLLEWSKVKPECPLCKTSFRSIYHNFRSSTEYDEYVVPAPIPHLSIRLTASGSNYRLSPDIMMVHDGEFASYGLDLSMMRDAFRDRRYIRVLEARAAHQHTPMNLGHHPGHGFEGVSIPAAYPPPFMLATNPFNPAARPEYFGDVINEHRRNQESAVQMPGYQNRRRRYDRNEWVQPFGSTLQPGSVIFPSVEYIRSHPSAVTRLRTWLYRELNVLLGLVRSREQMGFVYDLIMHLINHHDIRSRDFRDMVNSYFGSRTPHFQHEMYHFLLSGMSMEEFDRVAEYPGPRRNGGPSAAPEIITLDSDEESRSSSTSRITANRNSQLHSDIIMLDSSSSDDEVINPVSLSRVSRVEEVEPYRPREPDFDGVNPLSPSTTPPIMLSNPRSGAVHSLEDFMMQRRRQTESAIRYSRASNIDPDMPRLEPQVYPHNQSDEGSLIPIPGSSTTIDRNRATAATTTVTTANPNMLELSGSGQRNERFRLMDASFDLDMNISVGPYSSPPREVTRPLASPDFPILTLRRHIQERERERSNWERARETFPRDHSAADATASCAEEDNRNPFRSYMSTQNRTEGQSSSAFVPLGELGTEELRRPPRPSCIHASNSSSGLRPSSPPLRIHLYPHGISNAQVMDLSRSAGLISSSARSNQTSVTQRPTRLQPSTSSGQPSFSPPVPGPSSAFTIPAAPKQENKSDEVDDIETDELECLGSFPIEKKPPLAVITLSSDDEDTPRVKPERNDQLDILTSGDEREMFGGFLSSEVADFSSLIDQTLSEVPTPAIEYALSSSPSSSNIGSISVQAPMHLNTTSTLLDNSNLRIMIRNVVGSGGTTDPSPSKRGSSSSPEKRKKHKRPKSSKRSKRVISSSSESSDHESSSIIAQSHSLEKSASPSKRSHSSYSSSSPVCVPKKRKVVLSESLPPIRHLSSSSSDESQSSEDNDHDSDYVVIDHSAGSRKHSSSPKKRKHKSKSKKSKKSKRSKEKTREKDKSKKRCDSEQMSGHVGDSCSTSTSIVAGGSNSSSSSGRHKPRKRDDSRTVQPSPSSASTSLINFCDFDDHPSGLLDLSFNNREEDEPLLPQVVNNDEESTIELRVPPPTAPSSSSSTVDPSVLFGSPSRTIFHAWWDDYATSERRGWND